MHRRRASIAFSKSRRRPGSPRSPTSTASPRRRASRLFTTWHAQHHSTVDAAAKALAGKRIRSMQIHWHEDVHKWHPGPAVDLGAGGLRRVRSGNQCLLDRDEDLPGRPVRPVGRAQLSGKCPDADRRRCRPSTAPRPMARSARASTGAGPKARNGRSPIETSDGTRVRLEDGGARLILNGETQRRRWDRRISGHLQNLRRPDRRAAEPRRRRAAPARRRLPPRWRPKSRRSRQRLMEQLGPTGIIPSGRTRNESAGLGTFGRSGTGYDRRIHPG